MAKLEQLMTISAELDFKMIGDVGAGVRLDVPFVGTATSQLWENELPVDGIDFVTMRADGIAELIIRARVGAGKDTISYQATGLSGPDGIQELLTFNTASEKFAALNSITAVAIGTIDGNDLHLNVFKVTP